MSHIVWIIGSFICTGVITPIVVGIFLRRYEKKNDKQNQEVNARSELRQKEGKLAMKVNMSTMSMAYATAMAVKRGHANGEMEAAIDEYNDARKAYLNFINDEHVVYMDENK